MNNPIPLPEMLVERLGPEGKELLDLVQSMAISPEEGAERLVRLSVEDRRVLLEILPYLDGAHDVEEGPQPLASGAGQDGKTRVCACR